ncbi:MAG: calcium/sodium antiporter [Saprospiraceae bacterium]|nr:calcium/sodium antiporter [Saprospiraceae bacterium]
MEFGIIGYIVLFAVSLFVLLKASNWFISAAEKIGLAAGISPFIIGVTIVAFGTSLPELATSIKAVFDGVPGIVTGNVVGSNITNILLVLPLTVILGREIILDHDVMDIDMPMLFGSSLILYFIAYDYQVSYFEAFLLLGGLFVFLRSSFQASPPEKRQKGGVSIQTIGLLLVGATLVYFGADYTIFSISKISGYAGIDPEVIALTLVALGTSLPEVVVSVSAARRGKAAIAVGNVIGSNIFNSFAVIGIPRLFGKLQISESMVSWSLPFMIGVTFLFVLVCISKRISRWEGWLMLLLYAIYVAQLVDKSLIH